MNAKIDRRQFLKLAGGGLLLADTMRFVLAASLDYAVVSPPAEAASASEPVARPASKPAARSSAP